MESAEHWVTHGDAQLKVRVVGKWGERDVVMLPSLGRGSLELPCLAGLHVVPSTSQVLQYTGALHLFLEYAQRRLDAVAFAEVHFDHLGYRPTFVTFSAAGPFWPCTTSNSTFSPSASVLNPLP